MGCEEGSMDDSTRVILGLVVGVALLYLGSRIRSRARRSARPPGPGTGGGRV
jgi:hypothetical protein